MIARIASGVAQALLQAAATTHPDECCGLLTGQPGLIEAIVTAKNVSPHPDRAFEIDPGTLLRTHREVRANDRHVVGHYHSHPGGNPEPSPRDAARATHNGQLWIIIAAGQIGAWQAVTPTDDPDVAAIHGRFVPVRLVPV